MKKYSVLLVLWFSLWSCNNNSDTNLDTISPTIPLDIEASQITLNSVRLSWTASTDNIAIAAYNIYQNGIEIAQTQETSYVVGGLEANTTYTFSIAAVDSSNNESEQSETLEVTTKSENTRFKVLVFTKTAGFNHNTKSESVAMMQTIANAKNFDVVVDDTGTAFNSAANLLQYKILFFTNTSGNTLNQAQRNNVEAYAAQGGNFMSNHAASDAYAHSSATTVSGNGKEVWDWYAANVTGCSVRNNPNHTAANFNANVSINNQNTQLTRAISFPWNDNEEWYYWEAGYLNNTFTELLKVSSTGNNSYDSARMTAQYKIRTDGGISFYTSMGHAKNKYVDKDFVQFITNVVDFIFQ